MAIAKRKPPAARPGRKVVKRKRRDPEAVKRVLIESIVLYKKISNNIKGDKLRQEELRGAILDEVTKTFNGSFDGKDDNGDVHRVTVVEPKTTALDQEGLKAALTDEQWAACHELVFSEARLEDLVARGTIDRDVVASFISEVPKTPYPKIT